MRETQKQTLSCNRLEINKTWKLVGTIFTFKIMLNKHTHTCTHNHTHTPENPSQKEIGPLYSINFHIFLLVWGKNNTKFIKML